ncbi:MAG: tRNA pseudouridine(38-40) synthase TruA [Candidatus Caldatribacteriaceae bacterium]
MRNLLLVLEYDGSQYSGWQVQKGRRTVQGTLEAILERTLGEPVRVCASGRTDAGVHAVGQVVNFCTDSPLSADILLRILRANLPRDLRAITLFDVFPDFHARKCALRKRYMYVVFMGANPPVFFRHYGCFLGNVDLDVGRMIEGSQIFLGTHDFTAFSSPRGGNSSSVRTVFSFEVSPRGSFLLFDIQASGFLYHMARFLVGELLMVGLGKKTIEDLQSMLIHPSYGYRRFHAPPEGLYLVEVSYPGVNPYKGLRLEERGFVVPFWVGE